VDDEERDFSPGAQKDSKGKMVSFLVRLPAELVEEMEWRFMEPAENLLKSKVGEMLEEFSYEHEEGDIEALNSIEVRELKHPFMLLKAMFHRILMDAALGRDIKERVFDKMIELHKFEKKMTLKARQWIESYAHEGKKELLSTQVDLQMKANVPTIHDR